MPLEKPVSDWTKAKTQFRIEHGKEGRSAASPARMEKGIVRAQSWTGWLAARMWEAGTNGIGVFEIWASLGFAARA
jgi:hypothetical protein